jgi:hypothetical protein
MLPILIGVFPQCKDLPSTPLLRGPPKIFWKTVFIASV